MANDPDILNDPVNKDRIKLVKTAAGLFGNTEQISITNNFSDDETIKFVVKYMTKGMSFKSGDMVWEWPNLEKILPQG